MAFNGSTQDFSAIQILNLIRLALRTGKLTFTGTYPAELYFGEGQLIYATSQADKQDLLQILARAGKLTEAQVEQIRERIAGVEEVWLSQWLLETGYVTKTDLAQSVHRHLLHTAYEVILQAEGEFTFADGELPSVDVPITAVDLRQVIDQGVHLLQEWDELQTAVPHLDIYLQATEQLTPAAGRLLLNKTEWLVATACNGQRSAQQIGQTLDLDEFQLRRIIHNLMKMDMIEIAPVTHQERQPSIVATPPQPSKFEAALQNIRSSLQQQLAHSW